MEKSQREALRTNRVFLVKNMEVEELVDHLEQEHIFSALAIESLKAEGARIPQVQRLLTDIVRRPPDKFEAFLKCLDKTEQSYIADKLRDAEKSFRGENIQRTRRQVPSSKSTPVSKTLSESSAMLVTQPENEVSECSAKSSDVFASSEQNDAQSGGKDVEAMQVSEECDPEASYTDVYKMKSNPRGYALIINNHNFVGHSTRNGTEKDAKRMHALLSYLGYETDTKNDLDSEAMISTIRDFSGLPEHENLDSTVVVILSHGDPGKVIGCDGKAVAIDDLVDLMNGNKCPALREKPKLFFIQACQGEAFDDGFVSDLSTDAKDDPRFLNIRSNSDKSIRRLPNTTDFLIAQSTVRGYVSVRNECEGSWYIQNLCQVFYDYAENEDVLSLLTKVNKQVAELNGTINKVEMNGSRNGVEVKQMPEQINRLRKKLFFNPPYPKSTAT